MIEDSVAEILYSLGTMMERTLRADFLLYVDSENDVFAALVITCRRQYIVSRSKR